MLVTVLLGTTDTAAVIGSVWQALQGRVTLPLICRQETLAQRGKATWPRSHSHQEAESGLVSWFPVPGLFRPQTYRVGGPGEGWEAKSLGSMCESLTPIVMGEMTGCSFLQNLNYEDCMREKQPSHSLFVPRCQLVPLGRRHLGLCCLPGTRALWAAAGSRRWPQPLCPASSPPYRTA